MQIHGKLGSGYCLSSSCSITIMHAGFGNFLKANNSSYHIPSSWL